MRKKQKNSILIGSIIIVVLAVIAIIATFYLMGKFAKPMTEKERFIEASISITCEILKDPSLSIDFQKSKELSQEIFGEYDFPVEDNEEMLAILDKYENDEEVITAIQARLGTECEVEQ